MNASKAIQRAETGTAREPMPLIVVRLTFLTLAAFGAWALPHYGEILRPSKTEFHPDFYQDWASARNHLEGLPVYSAQEETIPRYLGRPQTVAESDIEYNAHPPFSVLLALPMSCAGLDLPDAILAWNLVSLTAFAAALLIVAWRFPELRPLLLPIGLMLPVCSPVYSNFLKGQPTLSSSKFGQPTEGSR